jgi:RimJ/RimL family protein N-acetyltransferase
MQQNSTRAEAVPPLGQPDFETPRLLLRPRQLLDTEACLAMDKEPDVTRFVAGPWADPAAHRAFIEARTLGPWPPGHGYWSIFERTVSQRFLGWVLLIPVVAEAGTAEIGWRLKRGAWGNGYATEAAEPVMRHALALPALEEIIAEIAPANRPSLRVAEKLGMKSCGFTQLPGGTALRYATSSPASAAAYQA